MRTRGKFRCDEIFSMSGDLQLVRFTMQHDPSLEEGSKLINTLWAAVPIDNQAFLESLYIGQHHYIDIQTTEIQSGG